jgi:very-short-patch-repair endonuclease/predicted transcriptional regulator of viral defense system
MRREGNVDPAIGGKSCTSSDEAIARLAARQYGVVARTQLLEIGVGSRAIEHRLEKGRLHPVHRGVYAVGHRVLSREARSMAAVLAIGGDAVLSHSWAAGLWGIRHPANSRIEVTAPRRVRPPTGVKVHRRTLPADEVTVLRAIPVTTVPRTLLDLATILDGRQVERAIEEAEVRRLDDALSIAELVERYPGRRGTGVIGAILAADRIGLTITRSELEERFLALLECHSLPGPELNVPIEVRGSWIEVDCVWRRSQLIVELDGHASHGTAAAFERDRARDRALHAVGWRVLRITWRQLHREPDQIAADLRPLLR